MAAVATGRLASAPAPRAAWGWPPSVCTSVLLLSIAIGVSLEPSDLPVSLREVEAEVAIRHDPLAAADALLVDLERRR